MWHLATWRVADVGRALVERIVQWQVLFAPLTGIEMRRSRIEGTTIVAEMALTVNLTTPTIEQVIQKRMRLVQQMSASLAMESRAQLSGTGLEEACVSLLKLDTRARILSHSEDWFNDDENFLLGVDQVLKLSRDILDPGLRLKIMSRNLAPGAAVCLAQLMLRLVPADKRAGVVHDRFGTVGALLATLPQAEVARAVAGMIGAVPWWALQLMGVPETVSSRRVLERRQGTSLGLLDRRTKRTRLSVLVVKALSSLRVAASDSLQQTGVSCIVFGSVNIDFVLRVGDSWQTTSSTQSWGGKAANAGVALAKLGARPALIVRVGDDSLGRGVLRHFASEGMLLASNKPDTRVNTGVSVAVKGVDKEGKKTFSMFGALNVNLHVGDEEHRELELLMRASSRPPPLLLQLEIPAGPMLRAMELARACGAPICLRASPLRNAKQVVSKEVLPMLEAGVNMLFVIPPEGKALLEALGAADVSMPTTVEEAQLLAARLLARYPAMWAVQISFLGDRKATGGTLRDVPPVAGAHILCERPGWSMSDARSGSRSATPVASGGAAAPFQVLTATIVNDPREVDATGANDAFFGAFVAAAMRGAPSARCLQWACAAYYLTSFHHGAQASPTVTELEFFLGCEEVPVLQHRLAMPLPTE